MKQKDLTIFVRYYSVWSVYLIISLIIYFLSKSQGTDGISLHLFGGGDDGRMYWNQVQHYLAGGTVVKTSIYPIFISKFISFIGINDVLMIRLLNLCAVALLLMYIYKIINKILFKQTFNNKSITTVKSHRYVTIMLLFYLSLVTTIALSIYRDIWIYLTYIMALNYFLDIYIFNRKNIKSYLLLLLSIYFIYLFRKYAAFSFILSTLIIVISKRMNKKNIMLFLVIFGIYFTFFKNINLPMINMSLADGLNYRGSHFDAGNTAGSNAFINLNQSNYFSFLIMYVYSILTNMLGPFPWQVHSSSQLLVFLVESIPMVYILSFLYKQKQTINKVENSFLIHAFIWFAMIGISNDNIGTATRLRIIGWIPLIILFAIKKEKSGYQIYVKSI